MEMLQHLGAGFEAAFTLTNMLFICGGVTLGIIFGVTPGLGSVTALAILVPITFYEFLCNILTFFVFCKTDKVAEFFEFLVERALPDPGTLFK